MFLINTSTVIDNMVVYKHNASALFLTKTRMSLVVFVPGAKVLTKVEKDRLKRIQTCYNLNDTVYINLETLHAMMRKEFGVPGFNSIVERIQSSLSYPLLMLAWAYGPRSRGRAIGSVIVDTTYGLSPILSSTTLTCDDKRAKCCHEHGFVIVPYFTPVMIAIVTKKTSRGYYRRSLGQWVIQ